MAQAAKSDYATPGTTGRFGTLTGVFVPNILTILGIILFLRMGYVVGQGGLWNALAIVVLANTISLLTGLSLSVIATNMTVRAGGNYYLISRSLGLEIGGAIGLPLFLSQAISVAFYIIGFTEALQSLEFFAQIDARIIASAVTLVFVVIAYTGADFALKIQYFILAILMAALVSFFIGAVMNWDATRVITEASYDEGVNFWVLFALFFPAVTGIEVGTSLSGDLKDPSKSIPTGTIASILFTGVIYIAVIVMFAYTGTADQLSTDNLAMQRIAAIPALILAGVWASTLSSALGSVLAAPRTLQAIANDRVVPGWIASNLGSKTEPRMAVLITGFIALVVIWAGDLNAVAPIIAMFFLNTYGMVNLAAGIEKLVSNPSFRPRFNIPWFLSILGALGCYGAMFLIDPLATAAAIIISYGVFFALQRREIRTTWGDVRSGIWYALARWALINLENERWHVKNWRPNMIVFTGQPHNRAQLVEVARWLSLGRGMVTFFQLIVGDIHELAGTGLRDTARKRIHQFIDQNGMKAFAEAEIVPDFSTGAAMVAQSHGIGGITANSVLMGWSGTQDGRVKQIHLMRDLVRMRKSVLFLNFDPKRQFGRKQRINIWWQGRGGNEDLMLLLISLIERHPEWRRAEIKMLRIVDSEDGVAATHEHMMLTLEDVRVDAEPVVIVREEGANLAATIEHHSREADLTLMGMHFCEEHEVEGYADRLNRLVQAVGSVLLVRNAELDQDLLTAE